MSSNNGHLDPEPRFLVGPEVKPTPKERPTLLVASLRQLTGVTETLLESATALYTRLGIVIQAPEIGFNEDFEPNYEETSGNSYLVNTITLQYVELCSVNWRLKSILDRLDV